LIVFLPSILFRHLACVDDCVWGGRRDARIKDV
jgi:hypothetical protein